MEIKAATARLTGYRHQQDGTNCQDWVRYKMQDGIGVLSLCDGAGSCAMQRRRLLAFPNG